MVLGEALAIRADLKKRLGEMKSRITSNARVQQGEQPGFEMTPLLTAYESAAETFAHTIKRINRTNAQTALGDAMLSDALVERDRLTMLHLIYLELAKASGEQPHRHLMSEIRSVAQVRAADAQAKADEFARQRRELDVRIQAANWTIELLD